MTMSRLASALMVGALLLGGASAAQATTYYIGAFTGSTPVDDGDCGGGMGAHPDAHPCATIAYWRQHRNLGQAGDTIRLAPGTYTSASSHHCFDPSKAVTVRGSTASGGDTPDRNLVVVTSTAPNSAPCFGTLLWFSGVRVNSFTLRDLTIGGCNREAGGAGHCINGCPDAGSSGLTLANVRVQHAPNYGAWIGCNRDDGVRSLANLTITDSLFENNCHDTDDFGGGLTIAAVNGGTIARNVFRNNAPTDDPGPNWSCGDGHCDCDGLHVGGASNLTIVDNEIFNGQEDGLDLGHTTGDNCPPGAAQDLLIERNRVHDHGNANISMNACSRRLTLRNNFTWGKGAGFNQYYCGGYASTLENNTAVNGTRAFMAFDTMWPVTIRNNIFGTTGAGEAVFLDRLTTNAESVWENNVVFSTAGQNVVAADMPGENCTAGSGGCCTDPDGPGLPSVGRTQGAAYGAAQLAQWRADGEAGNLFGAETGAADRWAVPHFVNLQSPSAQNLHLQSDDTVAKDTGKTLLAFAIDFDAGVRPAGPAWDIGADECLAGGPVALAPPVLLDVEPLP